MTTTDAFRAELTAQIERATKQGRIHIEINAGELHRAVGGYPPHSGGHHHMPSCCNAMRDEAHMFAEIVHETESGNGAALTIRYPLPRR